MLLQEYMNYQTLEVLLIWFLCKQIIKEKLDNPFTAQKSMQ